MPVACQSDVNIRRDYDKQSSRLGTAVPKQALPQDLPSSQMRALCSNVATAQAFHTHVKFDLSLMPLRYLNSDLIPSPSAPNGLERHACQLCPLNKLQRMILPLNSNTQLGHCCVDSHLVSDRYCAMPIRRCQASVCGVSFVAVQVIVGWHVLIQCIEQPATV